MVSKVLVDSGKYGVVQSGDYSTGSVPAAAQVSFPKYIVCGVYGGAYGIAYWDGISAHSPVFNQNDPRVKNWALICSSLSSGRIFMFSFATMVNSKSMMYVFEIDKTEAKAGTYSPKTTLLYNCVVSGTVDVESLLNVPLIGDDVFFLRTSSECITVGLGAGSIFIKRCQISTTRCRHNGNSYHVMLTNGSAIYIMNMDAMTYVQATSSYSLDANLDRWWPVSDGFYTCDKHGGPTPRIVGRKFELWNGSSWDTTHEYYVESFLQTYEIAFDGTVTVTNDNGCVEVVPPYVRIFDSGNGSTMRETWTYALDPFLYKTFANSRCYGAGGNDYPLIWGLNNIFTSPATDDGPVYYYNVDAGPTSASNFKSKVIDFRSLEAGSGGSSITFCENTINNNLNSGARQLNIPMTYDTIVAFYSSTYGNTFRELKNEQNGDYSLGGTFDVLYYVTPVI